MSKVILVTGTSTGLGASVAIQAAAKGHTVYATMRDLAKQGPLLEAATAAGTQLHVLPLDVQVNESVESAVATVIEREGRIDVLVNNAGSGFVRSTEQATLEDVAWIMDVNFMGIVRTTKAVIPHMRQARSGHILNISSVGGLVGQPFNEIYCASKFAIEGYTEAMASYLTTGFGIHFTAVEPGGIRSEFGNSALKHVAATGGLLQDDYLPLLQRYMAGSQARAGTAFQTSDEVAAVVLACIESEAPPVRIRTSDWANALCDLKTRADPDGRLLQEKVVRDYLAG